MATLVSAQKWFFAGLGSTSIFLVAALVYFWKRRMSRKRLAEGYTSLAANDIHMNPVGKTRVPNDGRPRTATAAAVAAAGEYDDEFEEESTETLLHVRMLLDLDSIQGFWMMMSLLLHCHQNIGMNQRVRLRVLRGRHGVDVMRASSHGSGKVNYDIMISLIRFFGVYREDVWPIYNRDRR